MSKRLVRLTRDEHLEAARLLCGATQAVLDGLNLVGKAIGAAQMDVGIKARDMIDVRLVMHLMDVWDYDFGVDGNPYRAKSPQLSSRRSTPDHFPPDWLKSPDAGG